MPPELTRLRSLLVAGLSATAALWAPVEAAYSWVFRAAAVLANVAGLPGVAVKVSYRGLLGAMARHAGRASELSGALGQFRKVTRSYWPGLFHCYDAADLPRTDNDLEQLFGSHRYHERRSSGRKVASPGRWCGGRCGCRRRWRPGCAAQSGARTWRRQTSAPGGSYAPGWSGAGR